MSKIVKYYSKVDIRNLFICYRKNLAKPYKFPITCPFTKKNYTLDISEPTFEDAIEYIYKQCVTLAANTQILISKNGNRIAVNTNLSKTAALFDLINKL
jgi:hypothetical protein